VLLNTAGRLTDGDRLRIGVTLAGLRHRAAGKIYRSLIGDAEIRVRLDAGDQARLAWRPSRPSCSTGRLDRRTECHPAAPISSPRALIFSRAAMGEDAGSRRDACVRRDSRLIRRHGPLEGPSPISWTRRHLAAPTIAMLLRST
jgi:hypothetical protein